MAGVFGSRGRTLEARSGGKIVRARRSAGPRTPYDRPRLDDSESSNPNWISKLILTPTLAIASGAGKLISTVFSQDDSESDSDSDSDSEAESDSGSEGDVENEYYENDLPSQRIDLLKESYNTSENVKNNRKAPEQKTRKREKMCAIEELLMQETFTREEYHRLVNIIESRVVDGIDVNSARLAKTPKEKSAAEEQDLQCTAVMEARKWLSEKKLKSASKSNPDNVVKDEVGSPVDMAKLYMRTRPLWASPTPKRGDLKSPSPVGTLLFDEETPYSAGSTSLLSSKLKRDSSTTGSWNIQEELQRVRAKATEDMLSTLPSKKIDWSSFGFEKRASLIPSSAERIYTSVNEKLDNIKLLNPSKQILSERYQSNGPEGLESTPAELQIEASLPDEVNIISEKNQDSQITRNPSEPGTANGSEYYPEEPRIFPHSDNKNAILSETGIDSVHDDQGIIVPEKQPIGILDGSLQDQSSQKCSTSKEMTREENEHANNGSLPLGNSHPVEAAPEQETTVDGDDDLNSVSSSSERNVSDKEDYRPPSPGYNKVPQSRYSTRKGPRKRSQVDISVKKRGRPGKYTKTKQNISTN